MADGEEGVCSQGSWRDEEKENSSRKKKKNKKGKVFEVEALAESTDRSLPIVGYFPSGYNASNSGGKAPKVRAFRNSRRESRLELVVSPRRVNVEFVGNSYSGEAVAPQICTYSLGVFDRDSRTLKIVPIAGNKIIRLEPKVMTKDDQPAEVLSPDKAPVKIADLTSLYGTKSAKEKGKKFRSLYEQRNDPATQATLDIQRPASEEDEAAPEGADGQVVRNIPPHDASAQVPGKAYLLDEIIPKSEIIHLQDILELNQSGDDSFVSAKLREGDYPTFVINRISKLRELEGREKAMKKLAYILSSISHLVHFMELANEKKSRYRFPPAGASYYGPSNIPGVVYRRLLRTFVDPESSKLASEKQELLVGYILVLALFADGFRAASPHDIAKDLKMRNSDLRPYFLQLGCKETRESFQTSVMTLTAPLEFPQESAFRNRKRRKGGRG